MGKKLLALVLLCAALTPFGAYAQSGSITGTVTDAVTGEELPGANVYLLELKRGASTDINGEYTIALVPAGTYSVVTSFLGYKQFKTTIEVGSSEITLDIELSQDIIGLEDVVVTGLGSSTTKLNSAVAVSQINAEDLTVDKSYQDISQLLGGKITGVTVQPASGQVGGGIRFNIRSQPSLNGNGQPTIFIDGIRIDNSQVVGFGSGGQGNSTLADLNPEDIASIDVLKGPAAAALYGTSGGEGVVLITTKRGQAGANNFSVNFKTVVGVNQQAVDAKDAQFLSADNINDQFRDGNISQNSLSVSGGNQFIRYFTSLDSRYEEGAFDNNELSRQALRANFDAFPTDKVQVSVSTSLVRNRIDRPQNDNNINGIMGNLILGAFGNPWGFVDSADVFSIENRSVVNRFLGSVKGTYRPIQGLTLSGSIGYDQNNVRQDESIPFGAGVIGVSQSRGSRSIFTRQVEQFTWEASANYDFEPFEGVRSTTVVGTQIFSSKVRTSFLSRQLFNTELITQIGAGEQVDSANEGFSHSREAGIFFQEDLNYNETYFLGFGGRVDYASAVGDDASTIFYPRVNGAVRLDKFGFLPEAINTFKVRAAYGESGNLPGPLDGLGFTFFANSSGAGTGAGVNGTGNPDLEPERVKELELGFETTFFNNYGIDFTVFFQKTEDSIVNFPPPPSTGIPGSIPRNVGEVTGKGIEVQLTATPILTRSTQLDLTLNWSWQENEVDDLGGLDAIFDGFGLNVIQEDRPIAAFFPVEVVGPRFNEAGVFIGPEFGDRVEIGNPYPDHIGSFAFDFRFLKNFNVYSLFEWQIGLFLNNNTRNFAVGFRNDTKAEELRAQLGFNSFFTNEIQPLTPGTPEYIKAATEWATINRGSDFGFVEQADFIRWRELSVRYNLNDALGLIGARKYVKNASIAVTGRNLWLNTLYQGLDPEVNFTGARSLTRGQDFLTTPQPRTLTATLSVGF